MLDAPGGDWQQGRTKLQRRDHLCVFPSVCPSAGVSQQQTALCKRDFHVQEDGGRVSVFQMYRRWTRPRDGSSLMQLLFHLIDFLFLLCCRVLSTDAAHWWMNDWHDAVNYWISCSQSVRVLVCFTQLLHGHQTDGFSQWSGHEYTPRRGVQGMSRQLCVRMCVWSWKLNFTCIFLFYLLMFVYFLEGNIELFIKKCPFIWLWIVAI